MYLSPTLAKPDGEIRIWEELPKFQLSNDWYLLMFSCSVRSDSLWAYGPQHTREAWSFPVLHHLPEYSQTHVHWVMRPSNHLILCHPLLLLPLIFPRIRVFSNESALHMYQVTKVLELQLQHQSFKWIFRVDLLQDWLVWSPCSPKDSQESLHHHNLKVLNWAFFMVQHSHPYMTIGKTIALTIQTFVGKVMSLRFNVLSSFYVLVIACLLRSKRLLISWLWSPSAVILEPKKVKSATVSIVSPSICHEAMGVDNVIIVFCHDIRSINAMILAVSSQWLILLLIYCFYKEKLWDLPLLHTVPILWSQGTKVRSLSVARCAWYSLPDSLSILSHHLHYPGGWPL